MVVLNEHNVVADRVIEYLLIEAFYEKTARVPEYFRLEDENSFYGSGCDFHVGNSVELGNSGISDIDCGARILRIAT